MRKGVKIGIAAVLAVALCVVAFLLWPKPVEEIAIGETAVLRHTVRLENGVKLSKGDPVCVICKQKDRYYVVTPIEGAMYAYVPKSVLTTDKKLMAKANYASVSGLARLESVTGQHGMIYDGDEKGYFIMRVVERGDEWSIVEDGDVEWRVKSEELLTVIDPKEFSVDLAYADLQQKADAGEETWRLSAYEVALRYARETKKLSSIEASPYKGEDVFYGTDENGKQHRISVWQPVKKDESGIWVVCDWTLREHQIESLLPPDAVAQDEEALMSGGYDIVIKPERTVYVQTDTEARSYGNDKPVTLGSLEALAISHQIDVALCYGKALEIYTLDYNWQDTIISGIFAFEGNDLIWHFIFNNPYERDIAEATLQEWKWGDESDYHAAWVARYGEITH